MTPLQSLVAKENPLSRIHSTRTAAAAVLSLLVAQLFGLPEAYWAGITTLAVIQSTTEVGMPVAVQYFAGTAVGAILGGWVSTHLPASPFIFGACALLLGILFAPLQLERSAYRTATITLAIIILVRAHGGWTMALHRFIEVSIGIAVALAASAVWPERSA